MECSPLDYLQLTRMEAACALLMHTDTSVLEVGSRAGFATPPALPGSSKDLWHDAGQMARPHDGSGKRIKRNGMAGCPLSSRPCRAIVLIVRAPGKLSGIINKRTLTAATLERRIPLCSHPEPAPPARGRRTDPPPDRRPGAAGGAAAEDQRNTACPCWCWWRAGALPAREA